MCVLAISKGLITKMSSIRLAFSCGTWRPTEEQWVLASRCLQPEEKLRVGRFVFQKDAKSAIAGRLLIRKTLSEYLHIPYNELKLSRTEKGKPFVTNDLADDSHLGFYFNVSHQGNYAVLAAESHMQVGVDVMQIELRSAGNGEKFLETMVRQFTSSEWAIIKEPAHLNDRLARFYRFWCLKESYVKALGVGVGFDLQRISFTPHTLQLRQGHVARDTHISVDGIAQPEWTFEETMLDQDHIAAVALSTGKNVSAQQNDTCTHIQNSEETSSQNRANTDTNPNDTCEEGTSDCSSKHSNVSDNGDYLYRMLSFSELTAGAVPMSEPDHAYWTCFDNKMERPGLR